jgi:hypothetical protein
MGTFETHCANFESATGGAGAVFDQQKSRLNYRRLGRKVPDAPLQLTGTHLGSLALHFGAKVEGHEKR